MADQENDKQRHPWAGKKPTDAELQQILAEHKAWIEAGAKGDPPHDLTGVDLYGRNLEGVLLKWARLSCANLSKARLKRTDLNEAWLQSAILEGADLKKANLERTDLQNAKLMEADLREALLRHANLKEAHLSFCDLRKAKLYGASLDGANMWQVRYNRRTKFNAIRVENCHGNAQFKRFAQDQDFIEEIRGRPLPWKKWKSKELWLNFRDLWWRKLLYSLWLVFADCGRTPWYWLSWAIFFAVGFGFVFFYHLGPSAFHVKPPLPETLGTMIYYSVVTFTTLGFGDITPKTPAAAYWVMAEVILGYVMLGGLISILMTKLARRS